jgi:hypothetical protein
LGQGNGGQYNPKAGRVVDIGVAAATGPFLGNTASNYRAISIAAGQSSSAVVLRNITDPTNLASNRVVTFGSNGLYEFGNLITQSGTTTCTGNNRFGSGTLGRGSCGSTACGGQGAQNENADNLSYEYPVLVLSAAATPLSGVTTVSDGDAWYFATNDVGGNAVAWGWNRRGELSTGTFTDNCFATSLALPTSCAFDYPCPGQPQLPANFSTCPIFSQVLDAQVDQTQLSYRYNWQYRATPGSGAWTDIALQGTTSGAQKTTIVTSTNNETYTANLVGEYRVLISDTRTSVAFLCAPCPVLRDSVTITQVPNPYTTSGCTGATNSEFSVTDPLNSKIIWWDAPTGGTRLNPTDSLSSINVANTTAPVTPACGVGQRALFAEDATSSVGFLFPTGQLTPTQAQVQTAVGCATLSTNGGNDTYLGFQVHKNVKLTSVSILLRNTTGNSEPANGTVNIFTNSPASFWNGSYSVDRNSATHVAGSPVAFTGANVAAGATTVRSVALNIDLTPGIYWIRVNANYNIQPYFNCSPAVAGAYPGRWTTPIFDNAPGNNTISAIAAISPAQSNGYSSRGSIFDLKFETGTGYSCGRILVCQSASTCILPVEMLYFEASKNGNSVVLDWATASETNSKHFVVERSSDGVNWAPIGKLAAAGNSTTAVNYSFTDVQPIAGTSYYRLVQVDIDNSEHLSSVQSIDFYSDFALSIHPNPSKDGIFNVTVKNSDEGKSSIRVFTVLGQLISESIFSGDYSGTLNLSNLNKGVYMVTVVSGNQTRSSSIVIE